MLYPQEVELFYIIPVIRKEFAVALKKQGKGQKEIASLLGVTEAAISQYMKEKRAINIKLEQEIKNKISKSAKKIKNSMDIVSEVEKLLNFIRKNKSICKYHHKFIKKIPANCSVCFK